jgi:regulator of CtrA degradation
MSHPFGVAPPASRGVTVPFRVKANDAKAFMALFREGMCLVEETANYLDGEGRLQSKALKAFGSLAYATESMRLTTRLTQLATWLLARRAVLNGEEAPPGAADSATLLLPIVRGGSNKGYDELPEKLKALIEASYKLHDKICQMEAARTAQPKATLQRVNPVATQVAMIAAAFKPRA